MDIVTIPRRQIGEHGDKAEIREEWWRERRIRFVFEYGYPHGHPTHGIYISKETPKRKEIKPKGITCPEGIWSREAFCLLGEKEGNLDKNVGWLAQRLAEVLVLEPSIEVFTIDSYTGQKKRFDRDFLRSQNAAKWFVEGLIKGQPGEGIYIFVNREQFENYLADKPIENKVASPEPENAKPANKEKELLGKQKTTEKSLGTRERDTVLKMIIGMAIGGYSYDPKASKSPTAKEISDDLLRQGISVSDDTIRKWLKEAAEILPPDTE
ncbi:MAG: hypothetical protein KDI13_02575 [Alphaproteobacteria bacterium]|nr:hypothetical protein [Alphaproteobacteria bacterium]